ncbi:uncharacterized protein LOC108602918 [Drosophila busckii]|uniref:uncharacterized protein LOC108602918 n=1 Tax=Drosophila busckii TaxID=30019 RepID=UPI00083EE3FF|nr:uncharacterized protein LOC108602918 [Drosophila busckii]
MDESVISIYDMLIKRHKQRKREEQLKEALPTKRVYGRVVEIKDKHEAAQSAEYTLEGRKIMRRCSHAKVSAESDKQKVTAAHLTKKHSGILLPPPTRKDVVNRLVQQMSSSVRKAKEQLAVEHKVSTTKSTSRIKHSPKLKPKKVKATQDSASSAKSRKRPVLSPRNTNRLSKEKLKRDKTVTVAKATLSSPQSQSAQRVRSKLRSSARKSKISVKSGSERPSSKPADKPNPRYRL